MKATGMKESTIVFLEKNDETGVRRIDLGGSVWKFESETPTEGETADQGEEREVLYAPTKECGKWKENFHIVGYVQNFCFFPSHALVQPTPLSPLVILALCLLSINHLHTPHFFWTIWS